MTPPPRVAGILAALYVGVNVPEDALVLSHTVRWRDGIDSSPCLDGDLVREEGRPGCLHRGPTRQIYSRNLPTCSVGFYVA